MYFVHLLILTTLLSSIYTEDCLKYGTSYTGYNIKGKVKITKSPMECAKYCKTLPGCKYFSWVMTTKLCHPKTGNALKGKRPRNSRISGSVDCSNLC